MNDSMQFGPEWLRNLSQHDEENTMAIPKYQLAEHRYGREEMLALFDRSVLAPEPLRLVSGLYVEKLQLPLALIQMSEEETRVWNSNVNNDTSQRSMIKSGLGQTTTMSQASSGISMSRGRGISVDRGKGRTSRGAYHYNNRNYADEGNDTSHSGTAFGRPRMFERSQSHNNERNWPERNGNVDYSDWNGYGSNSVENGLSTSPRKDFGTSMRLTSNREDTNWRRRPTSKDEDDGWRSNKHGRTGYNWRDGGERDREKEKDGDGQEVNKDRRWITRVSNMHSQPNRYGSETKDDNLPEWATESLGEGGGTFDSSGAFHGGAHSDDEDFIEKNGRLRENHGKNEKKGRESDSRSVDSLESTIRSERKPPISEIKNKGMAVKEKSTPLPEASTTLPMHNAESAHRQLTDDVDNFAQSASPPKSALSKLSSPQHQIRSSSAVDSYGGRNDVQNISKETTKLELDSRTSSQSTHSHLHEAYSQLQSKIDYLSTSNSKNSNSLAGAYDTSFNFGAVDNPLMTMNPAIAQNLGGNANLTAALSNKLLISPSDILNNSISTLNAKDSIEKSKSTSAVNALASLNSFNNRGKPKEEDLDCIVSKFIAEEEEKEKLKKLDGMNKWYYRDPQGQVQGPFPNNEMAEWYKLGYFHDKSLIVRRACESSYYPLHDLVTFLNGSPFETVTLQNFTKYSRVTLPGIQLNTTSNTIQPAQLPTNLPDDSSVLLPQPQHYPNHLEMLYARQQQMLAARKRQLSQPQEGMKSLFEQQKLISQHMNSTIDTGAGPSSTSTNASSQSTIPIIPGYMHPILPSPIPPSADPNFVMMFNQMQHQQQLHLLQQQLQQQHQPHHHHHFQQQQISHQQLNNDIKPDRLQQQQQQQQQQHQHPSSQPTMMSHLDHPLQQLVHKMNNLPASGQISMVQAQSAPPLHSMIPNVTNDVLQAEEPPTLNSEKVQTTNAIQNLLKQLGVSAEKQPKPVDSIWGSGNVSSAPAMNNNSFNAQHWCSQVGKIGPTSVTPTVNSGPARLWMQDNAPPTAAMKTEQEIIESFMKSMRPQEELMKEAESKAEQLKSEMLKNEEKLKQLEEAKKLEEQKARLEEEKRKKQLEEEKLRKIEEEQRRKAVEDAKRKEEERRRKEEEKRKREEEKEEKRKAEEEKKKRTYEPLQDVKDMQRKRAEAMKRLKEQQQLSATAGTSKPSLKSVTTIAPEVADQQASVMQTVPKVQKTSTLTNQLSKSQSGEITSEKKTAKVASVEPQLPGQLAVVNKQISKSKSTSSVSTSNQKTTTTTTDTEKKAQEKKKKDKNPTNAWADQKKIPQVKSLSEIQAEEQKKLAKQIEKEKQERLLQQQQAAANALAAKEATNFNMWKSQNQPWKNSWTSTSSSSSPPVSVSSDAPSRQPNTASSTNSIANRSGGGKNSTANNANTASGKVPSDKSGEASSNTVNVKNKAKKEDASSKKSSSSSTSSSSSPATQTALRNDDLIKWGVKALSGFKVSVDVPTFIGFLRDVESSHDVMVYVSDYLGDGKDTKNFVKEFLEKRSACGLGTMVDDNAMTSVGNAKKSKNKKATGSEESGPTTSKTKEYYCPKEPVSKTNSAEFVEVKAKSKKSAKKKVLRVDPALLGFNVTAAPDRINIGERDMGEDVY